jgi:hypothetical protein
LKEVATSEELASPGRTASSGRRTAIREKEKDPAPPTEPSEGVYVYAIIESAGPREFGKIGIGGRGDAVYTVHDRELAAVVSRTPLMVYDPTRENALAHTRVNEVLIEAGFTPVPMSFGTIFKTEKDALEFLKDTYDALRDVLAKMKDKLEFGLKVNWDREAVLRELEEENEEIRRLKAEIVNDQQRSTYFARMQLGRLVEQALSDRSDAYVRDIYDSLRDAAIASRSNKVIGEKMIMNAAFLVQRDHAEAFDRRVQEIAKQHEGKLTFRYTGPWPPYNFVTIRLQLERSAAL